MAIARRVLLFLIVNFLVITMLSIVTSIFGLDRYYTEYGLDYQSLAIMCLIWGMGGSFISLQLSRWSVKRAMGVQLIDPSTTDPNLRELLNIIQELVRKAGLPAMPEVGIYASNEINAFATGPSKSRSLVAVSTGLLSRMNRAEIEGVLGHEIAHIQNGDMVTMTLLQGIVNAFAMFGARVIAHVLMRGRDDQGRSGGFLYFIVVMVLQTVFLLLGNIVVAWFSRWREYRADAGGARYAGRDKMTMALESLQRNLDQKVRGADPAMNTLKISSTDGGFMRLWSSHPDLNDRITRLKAGA